MVLNALITWLLYPLRALTSARVMLAWPDLAPEGSSSALALAELADSETQTGHSRECSSKAGPPTDHLQPLCWLLFPRRCSTLPKSFPCSCLGPQQGIKSPSRLLVASAPVHVASHLPSSGIVPCAIHQAAGLLEGRQSPSAGLTCVETSILCAGQQRCGRVHICCAQTSSHCC